jgi:hypothetical protein
MQCGHRRVCSRTHDYSSKVSQNLVNRSEFEASQSACITARLAIRRVRCIGSADLNADQKYRASGRYQLAKFILAYGEIGFRQIVETLRYFFTEPMREAIASIIPIEIALQGSSSERQSRPITLYHILHRFTRPAARCELS